MKETHFFHEPHDIRLSQRHDTLPNYLIVHQTKMHMEPKAMLRGMSNISYYADDVKAARQWYNQVFGMEAYFQRPDAENPSYIEYRVGDYGQEVGIIDKKYQAPLAKEGPGGAVLYWHVDDIEKALERLVGMGASVYEPVTTHGEGFITASVIDPFGNVMGIMYNQHYLDTLSSTKTR